MGQYYKAVVIQENGDEYVLDPTRYGDGRKLMEHSWVGNVFVNLVLSFITGNASMIAWVGDYSNEQNGDKGYNFGDGFISSVDDFNKIYDDVWGANYETKHIKKLLPRGIKQAQFTCVETDYFLVNLTKKIYVDLNKYCFESIDRDGQWCINPLPILTCVGNGLGGGDYYGERGREEIGSWAFDRIYFSDLRPSLFTEVNLSFKE